MNSRPTFITIVALIVVVAALVWLGIIAGKDGPSATTAPSGARSGLSVDVETPAYFGTTTGYYAEPADGGDYPGIVMIHEWWGLNDNIKAEAERLASEGYRVLAVDLYRGKVATTREQAMAYRGEAPQSETTANLQAAADFLRDRGSERIASLGWCYGGGKSLELALSGEPLDATVIYYGTLATSTAELARINWPVLGIFGEEDASIPTTTVRQFESALDRIGTENEIYIYPGVGHAFANPSGDNYSPQETADAWQKTLAFLDRTLK